MHNQELRRSPPEAILYDTPFNPRRNAVHWFTGTLPVNAWTGEHKHSWGELLYVNSGSLVVKTGSGDWLAQPGRAIWIPPHTPHCWYVPCDAGNRTMWLDERPFLREDKRFLQSHIISMTPLVRELIQYLTEKSGINAEKQRRMQTVLVDLLLEMPKTDPLFNMPKDKRLIALCSHIIANPGNSLNQAQWANELGMSERNLARLFKQQTGVSFHAWRKQQRMLLAKNRLEEGECVTSIAIECGYSSLSSFISAFRDNWGRTPGEIAKNYRADIF